MDPFIKERNEKLAKVIIKGLESRNMSGYYAASKEEAKKLALSMIPEGSTVAMGGAMSAVEIGLTEALNAGKYHFVDRNEEEDKDAAMRFAFNADIFISSVNAMTEDGVLINIDGTSNRVAAIAQGPKKVIFIVGMNKVCSDVDSAMKRARNVAAAVNSLRFPGDRPCKVKGSCVNCKSPDSICCNILITRFSRYPGRYFVIFVNDSLGF